MQLTRRNMLGGTIAALLLPVFKLNAAERPDYDAECELLFENGDVQRIFMKINEEKKTFYSVIHNTMNHYKVNIVTTFDLEPIFWSGLPAEDIKPVIDYTGFDKAGNVIYQGKVIQKTWRAKP